MAQDERAGGRESPKQNTLKRVGPVEADLKVGPY